VQGAKDQEPETGTANWNRSGLGIRPRCEAGMERATFHRLAAAYISHISAIFALGKEFG